MLDKFFDDMKIKNVLDKIFARYNKIAIPYLLAVFFLLVLIIFVDREAYNHYRASIIE